MTCPPFPSMHRYRKKQSQTTSSSATGGLSLLDVPCNGQLSTSEQVILHHNVTAAPVDQPDNGGGGDPVDQEDAEVDRGNLNSAQNLEDTYAFADAKRKLRLMLSEADLSLLASLPPMTAAAPPPAAIQGTTNKNHKGLKYLMRLGMAFFATQF